MTNLSNSGKNRDYRNSSLFNDFNRTHGYQLSDESSGSDEDDNLYDEGVSLYCEILSVIIIIHHLLCLCGQGLQEQRSKQIIYSNESGKLVGLTTYLIYLLHLPATYLHDLPPLPATYLKYIHHQPVTYLHDLPPLPVTYLIYLPHPPASW